MRVMLILQRKVVRCEMAMKASKIGVECPAEEALGFTSEVEENRARIIKVSLNVQIETGAHANLSCFPLTLTSSIAS